MTHTFSTRTAQSASPSKPDSGRMRRWRTIPQLAQSQSCPFTAPAIRALVHRSRPHYNSKGKWVEGNGLADAVCQLGGKHGKVLIDELAFTQWVELWVTNDDRAASTEAARQQHLAA